MILKLDTVSVKQLKQTLSKPPLELEPFPSVSADTEQKIPLEMEESGQTMPNHEAISSDEEILIPVKKIQISEVSTPKPTATRDVFGNATPQRPIAISPKREPSPKFGFSSGFSSATPYRIYSKRIYLVPF